MGGGTSKAQKEQEALALLKEDEVDKHWVENKTFQAENSLIYASSAQFNELRGLLEEPLGQKYLGQFATMEKSKENFFAWIDMEEFKSIPTPDYRRCIAKNIYQKYIKDGAIMQLGGITEDRIKHFHDLVYGAKSRDENGECAIKQTSFVSLQHMVFREMAENTFKRFKESELYKEYDQMKSKTYNKVDVDDFDYMQLLGQGAFGAVTRVVKRSTEEEYALKVMSKAKLLKTFGRHCDTFEQRRDAICIERDVYANTVFPFIVGMHYAFQTELDCIIVMEFARGGTLDGLIKNSSPGEMPEASIKFVLAELSLALHHLHCMNYVHRDLKPINILLDSKGHVKLADMGLVSRIDDEQAVRTPADIASSPSLAAVTETDSADKRASIEINETGFKPRRFTRVGTMGYKAPELLKAQRPKSEEKRDAILEEKDESVKSSGYGESVDWWALGVLAVEMYCGKNIYAPKTMNLLQSAEPEKVELNHITSLGVPSSQIPQGVSPEGKDFVDGMLQEDPESRLGTNTAGFKSITDHKWFADIDFGRLLNLEIDPPYTVSGNKRKSDETPKWSNFENMRQEVENVDVGALLGGEVADNSVPERKQKYFESWDYVAPATFKLELGKQKERMNPNNL